MMADGESDTDRLRDALAVAQADLQRHVTALSRLQGELAASRLEVAGARGETVHIQGYLRQSQADTESAHAHIRELGVLAARREADYQAALAGHQAATAGLQATVVALQAGVARLEAELARIRRSWSWRLVRPFRLAGRVLLWGRWRILQPIMVRLAAPSALPPAAEPPPAPPADPNAAYLFRPGPPPAPGTGPVTLEELHHLSRTR